MNRLYALGAVVIGAFLFVFRDSPLLAEDVDGDDYDPDNSELDEGTSSDWEPPDRTTQAREWLTGVDWTSTEGFNADGRVDMQPDDGGEDGDPLVGL